MREGGRAREGKPGERSGKNGLRLVREYTCLPQAVLPILPELSWSRASLNMPNSVFLYLCIDNKPVSSLDNAFGA